MRTATMTNLERIVRWWFEALEESLENPIQTVPFYFISSVDFDHFCQTLDPNFVTRIKSCMAAMEFEFDEAAPDSIIRKWGAMHDMVLIYLFPDVYERVSKYPVREVVFAFCYAIYAGRTLRQRSDIANSLLKPGVYRWLKVLKRQKIHLFTREVKYPILTPFISEDAVVVALEAIQQQAELQKEV